MDHEPIKRFTEHGLDTETPCSPMDPPDSLTCGTVDAYKKEDFSLALQSLLEEHEAYQKVLNVLEQSLLSLKERDWVFSQEISAGLKSFFKFFDEHTLAHNKKEEKCLFPVLREKFLRSGEHSSSPNPITPVEVMEADHLKVGQSASLIFNLLGLSARMNDPTDRIFLLEQALHLGQELVDTMRLHIYKENMVLFPLAQKLIDAEEWPAIERQMRGC